MPRAWPRSHSLFTQLCVAFAGVTLLTGSLLMVAAYWFSRHTLEKHMQASLVQQVAVLSQDFLHEYRDNGLRMVRSVASSPLFDAYLASSELEKTLLSKPLERLWLQTVADWPGVRSIAFVDHTGAENIAVLGNVRIKHYRHFLHPPDPVVSAFLEAGQQLVTRLAAQPPGTLGIAGPFIESLGEPSYLLGLAKLDLDTGKSAGTVLIGYSLTPFFTALQRLAFFGEQPLWVLTPTGQILLYPPRPQMAFDPRIYLPRALQDSATMLTTPSGLVVYQDVAILPGQPLLRLAISIPTALFVHELRPLLQFFSWIGLLTTLVACTVAFGVSRYIVRPIAALAAATRHLAQGDLSMRVSVQTRGEVQQLVDSFNQMAEDLQKTTVSRDALILEVTERQHVQQELLYAKEAADKANRAKSAFLATMSHELRTPLNSVIGFTNVLLKNSRNTLQSRDLDYLQRVRTNGLHLLTLVDSVLDLSRVEAGQMPLVLAPVALERLIPDLLAQLDGQRPPSVTLQAHVPPALAPLITDVALLTQILINLLGNALKFTTQGTVTVAVQVKADPQRPLAITVADTGIGIPPTHLATIFEAFQQVETGLDRRYEGTGLGLTIARTFCARLGYQLEAASVVGQGSTFTILLGR